jgi:hypothetical protein
MRISPPIMVLALTAGMVAVAAWLAPSPEGRAPPLAKAPTSTSSAQPAAK